MYAIEKSELAGALDPNVASIPMKNYFGAQV
jgi:hypothetical protein